MKEYQLIFLFITANNFKVKIIMIIIGYTIFYIPIYFNGVYVRIRLMFDLIAR